MRHVAALLIRELGAYFLGPMAYLVLLAFQVIAWINFWELIDGLSRPQQAISSLRDPLNSYISASTPFWFGILVAVPALTMRLLVDHFLGISSLGSPGVSELRWLKPVRPGDVLSLRVSILKSTPSRSKPDRGAVTSLAELFNQRDEMVMSLTAVNLIARRPAS